MVPGAAVTKPLLASWIVFAGVGWVLVGAVVFWLATRPDVIVLESCQTVPRSVAHGEVPHSR